MTTQCTRRFFEFHPLTGRPIKAGFDGGTITSDAGGLLLREVEKGTGIIERFAACCTDQRDAKRFEHTVKELVGQRVCGLVLRYEDLNDRDALRHDPFLAVLVEKADPEGDGPKGLPGFSRGGSRDGSCLADDAGGFGGPGPAATSADCE